LTRQATAANVLRFPSRALAPALPQVVAAVALVVQPHPVRLAVLLVRAVAVLAVEVHPAQLVEALPVLR